MVTSKPSQRSSSNHCFPTICCLWRRKLSDNADILEKPGLEVELHSSSSVPAPQGMTICRRFTLREIRNATSNFQSKIGAGGYSTMLRGFIKGKYEGEVAIRWFTLDREIYFFREMESLSNLDHPNIISLRGYCRDAAGMFVVYEYMSHGDLREQLLGKLNSQQPLLSWEKRLEICIGAARGLDYLHTSKPSIIHRNIKTSNILLDQNWVAKISNFGLSKRLPTSLSESVIGITTEVAGTMGYMDPEYIHTGYLTMKSDVYSFGVVLFEVLSARRPIERVEEWIALIPWWRQSVVDGRLDEIIDPCLKHEIAPDCLKEYADLAYDCTNQRAYGRPEMSNVVERLEHSLLLQVDSKGVTTRPCSASLLPTDKFTWSGELYSVTGDILSARGSEIEAISFEREMESPSITGSMLDEIEEIFSTCETEPVTDALDPSQISELTVKQSVKHTAEVGASTSRQSNIATVEPVAVTSLRKDEILLSDEVKSEDPHQTEDRRGSSEPEVNAKTAVERTVLKILKLLNTTTIRKIGVYGIAGVGKTTVLKALINYPKTKDMFDFIIWVSVSKNWSVRKMQDEVLRQLSTENEFLKSSFFMDDSEIEKELFQYLEGKKFLLVLDDVWERIELERVGIPNPSSRNGCALILATRKLEVCDDMHLINVVEVEPVSNEEAWQLFREQAGGIINAPGIRSFAQGIVERCGGLPLLVIVIGRALSGEEDALTWEQTSRRFSVPHNSVRDRNNMIQLLKFSFDQLKVRDIQSCFLHCALFPEDQEVNISEFVKYSIEEGLIAGSTADAYKRGQEIVAILVHAFLLESTINNSIKMHDVMRDLALSILSVEEGSQFMFREYTKPVNLGNHSLLRPHENPKSNRFSIPDHHQFILKAGSGLTQPPSVEEWGKSKMIFLMDNKLSTLPERPSCHGLLTLFLQRNFRLRVIPMSFFDSMPFLKVLNLSKTRIKFLPKTISKLSSLETLILRDCERLATLPSDIGTLKLLQVLDLRGTEINILPDEIGELASLRYFDVCFYGSINRSERAKLAQGLISSGIIARLHALESLRINVYPGDERWDYCVKSISDEVSKLNKLTSLSFYFPEVELLELFLQRSVAWIDQCLTEYNIVVGHDIKRIVSRVPQNVQLDYGLMDRCLRFVNGEKKPDSIVKVLVRCSALYLDHHLDISSISEFGIGNIKKLKFCIVSECHAVKAIVGNEELSEAVFPCLEHLNLHHLWNLEYIWEGNLYEGSFAMLQTLQVHGCPKLKYVLKSSMLLLISNLEELIVDDCTAIEAIILDDRTTELSRLSYPNIKRLTLRYLPALVNIQEGAWPLFEYISVYNCPNFKIFGLDSEFKHTLNGITGEKEWWESLEWKEKLDFEDLFTSVSEDDI